MADEYNQVFFGFKDNTIVLAQSTTNVFNFAKSLDNLDKRVEKSNTFLDKLQRRFLSSYAAINLATMGVRKAISEFKELADTAIEAPQFKQNTELAYSTALESAEKGKQTFRVLDDIARDVHMPAEKAHDLARDLMLQGLEDTRAIARVIEVESALVRTGQIQGAQRLKDIIEKSIVAGHFGLGGKGGARGIREFKGLGINAALAKELASGKLTVNEGIEKLADAIEKGPIGQVAAKKFGMEEFSADVSNAFRTAAQGSDISRFNESLKGLAIAITQASQEGHGFAIVYQGVVDVLTYAVQKATDFVGAVDMLVTGLKEAIPAESSFGEGLKEIGGAFDGLVSGSAKLAGLLFLELTEILLNFSYQAQTVGATIGFLADVVSDPLGNIKRKWEALGDTVLGFADSTNASLAKVRDLEDQLMTGNYKTAESEKSLHFHAMRAGKGIDYVAASAGKAKHALEDIIGLEDLVFLPYFGAIDPSTIIEAGHSARGRGAGFAKAYGRGQDPGIDVVGLGGGGAADLIAPMLAAGGGGGGATVTRTSATVTGTAGGKVVNLTWTGHVYVYGYGHGGPMEDSHLRDVLEPALIDAFERLKLELGG